MSKLIATTLACLMLRCAVAEAPLELGLIERVGSEVYFYFGTAGLPAGSEIVAIETGTRYRILGLSDPAAAAPLVLIGAKVAYPYTLSGARDAAAGVAALVHAGAHDVDASGLRVSSCLSSEGVHYSAWHRDDAGGGRVWSAYRALDHTTKPTCAAHELVD